MIRVIIYLIIVAALAYGAVWLAERPGEVAITWQGERIDTSVMVLAAAIAAIARSRAG
jgi:HemY protein